MVNLPKFAVINYVQSTLMRKLISAMRFLQKMNSKAMLLFALLLSIDIVEAAPRLRQSKKTAPNVFAEAQGKLLRWQFAQGEVLELKK
ncbi:MAG TPA: hypothetical protein PLY93_02345, partial [Turneriella sp.]|nr:hypothetical protein [Turneriella sp.]